MPFLRNRQNPGGNFLPHCVGLRFNENRVILASAVLSQYNSQTCNGNGRIKILPAGRDDV